MDDIRTKALVLKSIFKFFFCTHSYLKTFRPYFYIMFEQIFLRHIDLPQTYPYN